MRQGRKLTIPVFVMFLAAVLTAGLAAQERMTLQQFIDEAVRNSPSVEIVGQAVDGAEYKIREARSQYLPQINLSSSYTRISLLSEFDIPNLGHFKFGTPDNLNFRAGVTEQVFTWGRVGRTVEMSRIGKSMAEEGVTLTKQTLAYQIVPIFYGVLFTNEAVKVLDQTIDLLQKKLAILEERYRAGLVSDFDISLIQVQVSGLQSQKLDFQTNVRKMMMAYNRIAGRPVESVFVPDGEFAFEPVPADARALLVEAVANRVEARQIQHQKDLARTQIALARTADKPNVVASFNYYFQNGFLPNVDRIKGNWNATLAVSYPLFDGRRAAAQVAQSQVVLRTVEAQEADMRTGFELEIDQALADLQSLEQKIAIEKTKIAHAEKALRIADERYQNGLMSATDLVEAQDSLDSARLNYLQLVYDHILSRFNLFKAAGRTIYSSGVKP
jgi:outer membrane protein